MKFKKAVKVIRKKLVSKKNLVSWAKVSSYHPDKILEEWIFLFWHGPFNEYPIEVRLDPSKHKRLNEDRLFLFVCGELCRGPYFINKDGKLDKHPQYAG